MSFRTVVTVLVAATSAFVSGPRAASAELLPLSCDGAVGASAALTYLDSSPEFEQQSELTECGTAPVGTWAEVSHDDDTRVATVSARAEARSDDGFVLEAANDLLLEVDDGPLDFASVALALGVEARFTTPPSPDPVRADIVVEIVRSGELEDAVLALIVTGPGVDLREDLGDEPDGELRLPVELEPAEEYAAAFTADAALTDSGQGSQTLRFSVDVVPIPEPDATLLFAVGAAVLVCSLALGGPSRFSPMP